MIASSCRMTHSKCLARQFKSRTLCCW